MKRAAAAGLKVDVQQAKPEDFGIFPNGGIDRDTGRARVSSLHSGADKLVSR